MCGRNRKERALVDPSPHLFPAMNPAFRVPEAKLELALHQRGIHSACRMHPALSTLSTMLMY